ncbi:hypothetical protein [Flavobacterium hiemivividum]|uniref:Uncharacterized protein n=1 Tax=Flavobacterium hiemivividum TaxID=2541734 RepID=A0A4R5CQC0_9FLAO|nr:hypothetical protein [Flavobacterium hiemivividum]TDE02346.1 hypothetical protein E0F98_13020 [Flavobacterium hiemivividum]
MTNKFTSSRNRIFFSLLVFGIISNGYSQEEFKDKFKAVPPKQKELKSKAVVSKIPDPPKVIPYVAAVIPENTFVVPKNDVIVASDVYHRNQDLGTFKTTSKTTKVRYRDAAYVDGDRIRTYINYKVVDYEVLLEGDFKGFEITLEKGINRIDFEALNEGFAAPNTAEFQVYDDKGKLISASQWNIGTGYKATIMVEKE